MSLNKTLRKIYTYTLNKGESLLMRFNSIDSEPVQVLVKGQLSGEKIPLDLQVQVARCSYTSSAFCLFAVAHTARETNI